MNILRQKHPYQIDNDVFVEYQTLPKIVYFERAASSLHLLFNPIETWQEYLTHIVLQIEKVGFDIDVSFVLMIDVSHVLMIDVSLVLMTSSFWSSEPFIGLEVENTPPPSPSAYRDGKGIHFFNLALCLNRL